MVRLRLTLTIGLVVSLVLTAFGWTVYRLAGGNLSRAVDRELVRRAEAVDKGWEHLGPRLLAHPGLVREGGPLARQPARLRRALFGQAFLLPKFFLDGRQSVYDGGVPWSAPAVDRAWKGESRLETVRTNDEWFRVLTRPLRIDGKVEGVVQLAASLGDAQAEQARLASALTTMIPGAVIVTVLLSVLLARFALHPVGRIARVADRIQASRLTERLPVQGRDEIANLSTVFNSVLDRLEAAFEAQRRFVGDASHELKSPLAAIKVTAEIAALKPRSPEDYERSLRQIVRNVDGMSSLVGDMLILSQADEGALRLETARVKLRDLAEDVLSDLTGEGPDPTIEIDPDLTAEIDPARIARVLRNLLENARRHTPPQGSVVLRAERGEASVRVEVSDTGTGIADADLPHVFDRFFRSDPARERGRGGTGLGLAICRSLVEAHGGAIGVRSQSGVGTTFWFTLPA